MQIGELRKRLEVSRIPDSGLAVVSGKVVRSTRTVRGVVDPAGHFWTEQDVERAIAANVGGDVTKYLVEVLQPSLSEHLVIDV